jgi:hypothetical protein
MTAENATDPVRSRADAAPPAAMFGIYPRRGSKALFGFPVFVRTPELAGNAPRLRSWRHLAGSMDKRSMRRVEATLVSPPPSRRAAANRRPAKAAPGTTASTAPVRSTRSRQSDSTIVVAGPVAPGQSRRSVCLHNGRFWQVRCTACPRCPRRCWHRSTAGSRWNSVCSCAIWLGGEAFSTFIQIDLGDEYRSYQRATHRIVPGLW